MMMGVMIVQLSLVVVQRVLQRSSAVMITSSSSSTDAPLGGRHLVVLPGAQALHQNEEH